LQASVLARDRIKLAVDRSTTIRVSLRDVRNHARHCVILVISWCCLPAQRTGDADTGGRGIVSLVATFAFMYRSEYSLNIFSLMADDCDRIRGR